MCGGCFVCGCVYPADVVKLDVGAVVRLLTGVGKRPGYIRPMPIFTLAGVSYDYARPAFEGDHEDIHSWEYGQWPKVEAALSLASGGTVQVYAEAMRWTSDSVLVRWREDGGHYHDAWVPTPNVCRLTASEWDIIEYHQCPPELRPIRWGNRFPGFLPR